MGKSGLLIIDVNNIGVAIGDSNTEELKWSLVAAMFSLLVFSLMIQLLIFGPRGE